MESPLEVREADRPQIEDQQIPIETVDIPSGEIPTEDPVGVESSFTEEPQTQEESPKNASTRFEYWQSQADKAKGELDTIRQELNYYKDTLAPVEQMIRSNPQVLDNLESSTSNGQAQGQVQETSLKEPTAPDRPHSYNEVDAYNDPESDSFKYRIAKEQYRDSYLDFLKEKDQVREMEMAKQYETQMQQQQAQMVQQQATSHAVNSYGWDVNKANEFVSWAKNPDNLTLDNLAKLFELRANPNPVVKQRTDEMQRQSERLSVPKTASVQRGKPESVRTDEQLFSDALLGR